MNRSDAFNNTFESLRDQIATWKGQHGKVYLVGLSGLDDCAAVRDVPFIFRHPARAEISRMVRDASKDPIGSISNLVQDIALYPDRATLGTLLEQLPGLAPALQDGLKDHIGVGLDFTAQVL